MDSSLDDELEQVVLPTGEDPESVGSMWVIANIGFFCSNFLFSLSIVPCN